MRIKNLNYKYDPQSQLPKYLQLADALRRWISREQPAPGTHFPGDRQIASCCETTPITASKAIKELVKRGMVERKLGSGSVILENQQFRTKKIGIFCNLMLQPGDLYTDEVISELNKFWTEQGYELITRIASPRDYERRIFEHNLSGAMIITPEADYMPQIAHLRRCGVPLVSIGFMPNPRPDFAFGTDHIQTGVEAVEYLYGLGHRKISVIGSDSRAEELRKIGYAKGMYKLQLPVNPDWNIHTEKANWEKQFVQMMQSDDAPSAAVVTNQSTAEIVFNICSQEKIAIPEHLSVIGFDHIGSGYHFSPTLTVLAQPVKDFTRFAAQKLLQYILGNQAESTEMKNRIILEEGGSCSIFSPRIVFQTSEIETKNLTM